MNIQKFVNNSSGDTSFHSNGFAEAASRSAGPGSTPQSFGQRATSRGGKAVRSYGHSMIGRGHMRETARMDLQKGNPLRPLGSRPVSPTNTVRPIATPIIPPRKFNEPPSRGYTPFS